jgi:hypothetical protein
MLIRVETVAAQEFLAQFARARLRSPIASHSTSSSSTSITGKAWGIEQVAIRAETGQLLFCLDAKGAWPAPATALRDGLLWYTPKEHTADDVMALLLAEVQAGAVGGRAGGAAFGARAAPTEGGAGMREGA